MLLRLRKALGVTLGVLRAPDELKHPLPVALIAAAVATMTQLAFDPILRDHSPFLFSRSQWSLPRSMEALGRESSSSF